MMKKIVLILLVGFVGVSVGVLWLSYRYPATPNAPAAVTDSTVKGALAAYDETEVARHSTASDCWLIVRGDVYDVSTYLNQHPGGRRAITVRCGLEVTSTFAAIHSNRAWNLLGDFRIGSIGTQAAATATTGKADITTIDKRVAALFPDGEVLKLQPFGAGYLALVATGKTLLDVIVDADGAVISQQARSDEFEWFWNADDDEVQELNDTKKR